MSLWLGAHLSQQLTQHGLEFSGIGDLLVDQFCPRLDLQSVAHGVEIA